MQVTPRNFNTPFKTAQKESEEVEKDWQLLPSQDADLPSKMQRLDINDKDEFVSSAKLDAANTQATKKVNDATTQKTEKDAKQEWDKRWSVVYSLHRLPWGANPNGFEYYEDLGATALYLDNAIRHDDLPCVQALLASGADPNKQHHSFGEDTLLYKASSIGNPGIIQALLAHGADPNKAMKYECRTPLHVAASKDGLASVQALLTHGADPNKADIRGRTPLHLAASVCGLASVQALLASGADPNQADDWGRTPLHLAAASKDGLVSVQALLARGADPNKADSEGKTPLHLVAAKNDLASVQALLASGADPNKADKEGRTPLHTAVSNGEEPAVVQALLDHGADANKADNQGKTPQQIKGGRFYRGAEIGAVFRHHEAELDKAKLDK